MYSNNYSILVLVILVTTTITGVFTGKKTKVIYVNVDDYHTCLPLLSRPRHTTSVPNQTIQLFGETLKASRHHVIPYNILATFFNLVLREDPVSELGVYLAKRVHNIWDFFKENDSTGAFPRTNEPRMPCDNTIQFEGGSATFTVDYRMLAAFTWLPGNIFYGPHSSRRTNDPKDKFDNDAERIVGTQPLAALRSIYYKMYSYINYLSKRTTTNFDIILNELSDVAKINTPYEFNQADWKVTGEDDTGNKLFGIKKPREEIHDKFRIDDYRKKRWAIIDLDSMCEDYIKAADRVCEVYTSHLIPKFNTNFTHVDIKYEIFPLLVYSINNKHFVYGQNKMTKEWIVRTVEQDGTVGVVTDQGSWNDSYDIQLPLEINGKQFLYGNNIASKFWFIKELNANGTIGRKTDDGFFDDKYQTQFHISIDGQHYLYGRQNEKSNQFIISNKWFLQILNANGTMGLVNMQHAEETILYTELSPYFNSEDIVVYTRNTNSSMYCIRETDVIQFNIEYEPKACITLFPSYKVRFPVSIGGKTYLFGHNQDSKHYIICQVFGEVLEQSYINYEITNAQPFSINGVQYFYARHKGESHWSLHRFDFKYLDNDIDV